MSECFEGTCGSYDVLIYAVTPTLFRFLQFSPKFVSESRLRKYYNKYNEYQS